MQIAETNEIWRDSQRQLTAIPLVMPTEMISRVRVVVTIHMGGGR